MKKLVYICGLILLVAATASAELSFPARLKLDEAQSACERKLKESKTQYFVPKLRIEQERQCISGEFASSVITEATDWIKAEAQKILKECEALVGDNPKKLDACLLPYIKKKVYQISGPCSELHGDKFFYDDCNNRVEEFVFLKFVEETRSRMSFKGRIFNFISSNSYFTPLMVLTGIALFLLFIADTIFSLSGGWMHVLVAGTVLVLLTFLFQFGLINNLLLFALIIIVILIVIYVYEKY